jgi:hypothetical protein
MKLKSFESVRIFIINSAILTGVEIKFHLFMNAYLDALFDSVEEDYALESDEVMT